MKNTPIHIKVTNKGAKAIIIAETATVMDWLILKVEIPFSFHNPAIVKAKMKQEQSLIPVNTTPNPIR